MKCERCGSGLGNVVPRISLEAAEADAVRFRDLYELRSELCETLQEQLSAADADGNRMEARIAELEAEIARLKTPEWVLGEAERLLRALRGNRFVSATLFYARPERGAQCVVSGGLLTTTADTLAEAHALQREVTRE